MKIGIDARALYGQRTGIGRFLHGILEAMARDDRGHEFVLYSPRPIAFPTSNPRWRVSIRGGPRGTTGVLWLQLFGPSLTWRDRLDVFWGPMFHLPILLHPRIPGIVTVHDLVHVRFPQTMERRNFLAMKTLSRPSLWRARHITADSHATADDMHGLLGIEPAKVTVIYPGIPRVFHPRDRASARERMARQVGLDTDYLLTVSTVEPRKNLLTLVHAYAALPTAVRRRLPLVIAGAAGWKNAAIYDAAAPLVRDGSVRFLGYVADDDLPWLYAGASAFLFPSLYEGFGIPVAEAMATGIPILASDIPVLREIAADTALYVPPTIVARWTSAILSLLEDQRRQTQLGELGRARAARFTYEESATRLIRLLELVAGARTAPVPA